MAAAKRTTRSQSICKWVPADGWPATPSPLVNDEDPLRYSQRHCRHNNQKHSLRPISFLPNHKQSQTVTNRHKPSQTITNNRNRRHSRGLVLDPNQDPPLDNRHKRNLKNPIKSEHKPTPRCRDIQHGRKAAAPGFSTIQPVESNPSSRPLVTNNRHPSWIFTWWQVGPGVVTSTGCSQSYRRINSLYLSEERNGGLETTIPQVDFLAARQCCGRRQQSRDQSRILSRHVSRLFANEIIKAITVIFGDSIPDNQMPSSS